MSTFNSDAERECSRQRAFYFGEDGTVKIRPLGRRNINSNEQSKSKIMSVKKIEAILKKHTSKVGNSIVFNITKAAEEINAQAEVEKQAEVIEKTQNYKFKLEYIKNVLSDIDASEVRPVIKRRKASKKRKNASKLGSKRTVKLKS